jgi:hypothetical protein
VQDGMREAEGMHTRNLVPCMAGED